MRNLNTMIILFKAHQYLVENVKATLVGSGVNVNEFAAMEALHTKGKLTTQQLIKLVLIPNSSMTYVLDNLEKKGYIQRERDVNDGRLQYISLTAAGTAFFKPLFAQHVKHMGDIFDVLSSTEEKELQQLAKRIGLKAEETLK